MSVKQTEKAKVFIKRRLAGDSVIDIARDMNVTRQSIYFFFSGFPKPTSGEDQVLFSVSEDMAFQICMFYYSCLPKRGKKVRDHWDEIMENAVRQTAEMFLLSEEKVRSVLYRLTEYHFPVKSTPHYNAIESWRRRENISLTELARISGCGKQQLRSILRGEQPLPERNAKLIAKHSGLSENDIYADIIRVECYQEPEDSGGSENAQFRE